MVSAQVVVPNQGSAAKPPGSGKATSDTGLKPCWVAKASASASVSRATTATCTMSPVPDQSKTSSSTA